jgi:hypothetical protein
MLKREFQYEPLPDEVRAIIMASWKRGAMLPPETIEQMVPAMLDAQSLPSDAQNAQRPE